MEEGSLLGLGDAWKDGGLPLLKRSLVHHRRLPDQRGQRVLPFDWLLRLERRNGHDLSGRY